jgi:pimeloyl-ACP methyl ester carboxylesterase
MFEDAVVVAEFVISQLPALKDALAIVDGLLEEFAGEGEPLLMVHGNGASIGSLGKQIEHFKSKYKVIAMDSREQGKSGGNDKPITYEIMTDDLAALMDHLKTGPVDVIGWSDGGIEALMLGIRHPDKVKKLVAMAANLNPTLEAIYPETDGMVKQIAGSLTPDVLATPAGKTQAKLVDLMANQPNIPLKALAAITAPTLIRGALGRLDVDCTAVTVPAMGRLVAVVSDGNGRCPVNIGGRIAMDVYSPNGTTVRGISQQNGPFGAGSCSHVDGARAIQAYAGGLVYVPWLALGNFFVLAWSHRNIHYTTASATTGRNSWIHYRVVIRHASYFIIVVDIYFFFDCISEIYFIKLRQSRQIFIAPFFKFPIVSTRPK